jgi:type IV secretion system protein VirD4
MKRRCSNSPLLLGRRLLGAQRTPMGFVPATNAPVAVADDLVTYSGESHLLCIGKTGAGKTSQAICNVLAYEGPMIIFDSTGSIYEATARRRREMGQEVHAIDLRDREDGGTGCLNPLELATYSGRDHAVIARSFAAHIVSRSGSERDAFWLDWAETMITAGISYALGLPAPQRNMNSVFDLFNNDDTIYNIAKLMDDKELVLHRSARAAFSGLLALPERETMPSVIGSTQAVLRLWDSDLIRRVTGSTSFDIDALIHDSDRHPMTLYIIVPSYRAEGYRPLLRLWFGGLLMALMQRLTLPERRTLLLSDETASFGRVDAFLTAATQARAFGVQLWTHWQNASQLEVYGKDGAHTLVDNAGVLQFLGAPNRRAAQEFVSLVGGIDADEILAMGSHEQLVLLDGTPQRLRRLRYFEEACFAGQYDSVMTAPSGARGERPGIKVAQGDVGTAGL